MHVRVRTGISIHAAIAPIAYQPVTDGNVRTAGCIDPMDSDVRAIQLKPAKIERHVIAADRDRTVRRADRDVRRQVIRSRLGDRVRRPGTQRLNRRGRLHLVERLHGRSGCAWWREAAGEDRACNTE